MTTFVLVHGAFHGASCWRELQRCLDDLGYESIAVDLPCDDVAAGASDYADAVLSDIPAGITDLILVGHSLGGITIPIVAQRRRVRRLVFLAAMVPQVGRSFFETMTIEQREYAKGFLQDIVYDSNGSQHISPERAIHWFYSDCEPELATWASTQLRAQSVTPLTEISPLTGWPDLPISYILCQDDRVLSPIGARLMVEDRLGVIPLELPGSHSPFLSRPEALAKLLIRSAEQR
jgi:pimeloyl-ACP methyl ester carboxylesterase